jgi:hypothetical protein
VLVKVCEAVRFMVCSRGTGALAVVLRRSSSSAADEVLGRYDRTDGLRCMGGVWRWTQTVGGKAKPEPQTKIGVSSQRGRAKERVVRSGGPVDGNQTRMQITGDTQRTGQAGRESGHGSRRGCVERQ